MLTMKAMLEKLRPRTMLRSSFMRDDRISTIIDIRPFDAIPTVKFPLLPHWWSLVLSGGPNYLHKHCDRLHRKLGPIFRERLGLHELVFLADTEMIQIVIANEGKYPHHSVPDAWLLYNKVKKINRGLFFQVGEPWLKLRRAFSRVMLADHKTITKYGCDILHISEQFLDSWCTSKKINNSDDLLIEDVKAELYSWSTETTGFMLFGNRMGCVHANASEDGRGTLLKTSVSRMFEETSKFQLLPCSIAQRLNLSTWVRFEQASNAMLQIAKSFAQEFISKARNGDCSKPSIINDLIELNQLTDDEIMQSIIDLIIAAADTTSNSVQWMLYLIAKHPEVQAKLYAELKPVLSRPHKADWTNLRQAAPYLNAFIREASRLYPTAPFLARTLQRDIVLDGYVIPAGKPIVFSLFTTSRMEKYYDEPLAFRPERWMRKDPVEKSHAYASLPFGVGSRMCIGRRAAELEMSLLIAAYVLKFKSQLKSNTQDIETKLRMTLNPVRPISLVLSPRSLD